MCKTILVLTLVLVLFGCSSATEYDINRMKKPITILAISKEGDVVLSDADGRVLLIGRNYYMAKAIADSRQVGDIFIPSIKD